MVDEPKSDIQLDLDALSPPKVQVNYEGQTIAVKAPTLEQYSKIIDISNELKAAGEKATDPKTVTDIYKSIEAFVKEAIPELADKALNMAQLSSLFKLLSEIGAPTDKAVAKLKEQGIDLQAEQADPKASASAEASPNSSDTTQGTPQPTNS